MNTLFGMKIIESPYITPVPKMQVSKEFERLQSPELVAETNAWMREFFGTHMPVYVFNPKAAGLVGDRFIAMSPAHMAMLRGGLGL